MYPAGKSPRMTLKVGQFHDPTSDITESPTIYVMQMVIASEITPGQRFGFFTLKKMLSEISSSF